MLRYLQLRPNNNTLEEYLPALIRIQQQRRGNLTSDAAKALSEVEAKAADPDSNLDFGVSSWGRLRWWVFRDGVCRAAQFGASALLAPTS